jgi:hypothetical protein
MQLILSMQERDDAGTVYPNIKYVCERDEMQRMQPEEDIYHGLRLMRDLLTLVDHEVYTAFHEALRSEKDVGTVTLNVDSFEIAAKYSMAFLQQVTSRVGVLMWEEPPHPCYFIMREVVADLLAGA